MDAEHELFELVNFGGLAQGDVDLDLIAGGLDGGAASDKSTQTEVNRTPEERTS